MLRPYRKGMRWRVSDGGPRIQHEVRTVRLATSVTQIVGEAAHTPKPVTITAATTANRVVLRI